MFEDFTQSPPSYSKNFPQPNKIANKNKMVILIQNGNPTKSLKLQFNRNLTREEILRSIQKNWGISINKSLRMFSTEGVQFLDEDLLYIKNNQRLYISRGQEFDSNSNFGQFQVIKKLGEGGFGTVDLAKNIITGQFAAIKVLKTNKNSSFTDIDMIFKQAENLKALNHPNIVKILNCYALKDMKLIIVMQYLEGGQLLELLKQKIKFDQNQARLYFKQILSAVSYCHRQGIIHRDLKLENILLKSDKILKVADFGISGVADRFNPEADWGTLRYMSPETLSGKNKINTPGVDIWAIGVILYQLVTGQLPFKGSSTSQIIDSITKKQVQFPSSVLLTQKCKTLIQRMLQKNPKQRITSHDIQADPWLQQLHHQQTATLKTVGSEQINIRMIELKKQQRKSIILPKNMMLNNVKIPKRLQKQKDQLMEQLRGYNRINKRNNIKSQGKFFPILKNNNRRLKYQKNQELLKKDNNLNSSFIEDKRKQLLKSWK